MLESGGVGWGLEQPLKCQCHVVQRCLQHPFMAYSVRSFDSFFWSFHHSGMSLPLEQHVKRYLKCPKLSYEDRQHTDETIMNVRSCLIDCLPDTTTLLWQSVVVCQCSRILDVVLELLPKTVPQLYQTTIKIIYIYEERGHLFNRPPQLIMSYLVSNTDFSH